MTKEQFISAIPEAISALEEKGEILPANDRHPELKRLEGHTIAGREFTVLEQNPQKQSRYAKLAQEGHTVHWLVRDDGEYFLVVDGNWTNTRKVSYEGELMANASIVA